MALVAGGGTVQRLTFGHHCSEAAKRAIDTELHENARLVEKKSPLVRRLRAYASGEPDSFVDVAVDLEDYTPFQRQVLEECRRIPFGGTITYAQLAARSGTPRAARAVGNCMAANRIPLIIPCHRVVSADGTLGPYSAAGGTAMKRRLLALESQKLA